MKKLSLVTLSALLCAVTMWGQGLGPATKLPAPFATPSANNRPEVIARPDGASLSVPAGFKVAEYASGFATPRFMIEGPKNEVILSDSGAGNVYVLIDKDNNFQADERKTLISGLKRPYGLAMRNGFLYVGDENAVRKYAYDANTMTVGEGKQIISLDGYQGGHWTRSLVLDPKQDRIVLGVGSASNVDAGEPELRATVTSYNLDGTGKQVLATGTRNPIGLKFYPGTETLWVAVQERDLLGDDLVPDYFTSVKPGGFYGWPYAYSGPNEDPRRKGEKPELVAKTIVPDVLLGAHVAVLDYTFYTGKQFPEKYRGGAFLAFHGSWNREKRVGQQIAFVPFKNGKATAGPEPFLTGWLLSPDKREVWGRPVGVLQLHDGSLLISDDGGKKVWRISYEK